MLYPKIELQSFSRSAEPVLLLSLLADMGFAFTIKPEIDYDHDDDLLRRRDERKRQLYLQADDWALGSALGPGPLGNYRKIQETIGKCYKNVMKIV